jgi:hypothetical protein
MRTGLLGLGFTLAMLAACSDGGARAPTAPEADRPRDLSAQAFRLTIDTHSGRIDVASPPGASRASAPLGLSLSLLGRDAVDVEVEDACTFTTIPDKPKYKRCTFPIRLRNRLLATDLVTPTQFPRPPQGASGILAFAWTAVSPQINEDVAPSPDWDLGPANFFNDFIGCSMGGKSDCYRYELFASPLYAGGTSGIQPVGFDVPNAAQTVTAYIVIAADLRDNPVRTAELGPVNALCGMTGEFEGFDPSVRTDWLYIYVSRNFTAQGQNVGFCSFSNGLPAGARVVRAKLRMFRYNATIGVTAEHVDYGTTLEVSDSHLAALSTLGQLTIEDPSYSSADSYWMQVNATSAVQAAVNAGRPLFQFRLMPSPLGDGFSAWAGAQAPSEKRPELVVEYRLP